MPGRPPDAGAAAVDLLRELVAIDSVNPGLVPGAAGEAAIVAHLQRRLAGSGWTTTVVPAVGAAGRPSLLALPPGPVHRPTIVLNGHLDTVGVEGMPTPFTPRIDGDRLTGRGAADMKGGIAALVVAAERLVADDAPVRPVLALVADEEDASLGSTAAVAALGELGVRPAAVLIAEPTDLAPARSLRGFAVVRVRFAGRAAHSSQPDQGVNAVTHLGRFVHRLDRAAADVRRGGGDLMVTRVSGGRSVFVVPDAAECVVERRTAPGEQATDTPAELAALLDPAWAASLELLLHRESWRLAESGPAADLAARLETTLGTAATFDAPYWMEAPLWSALAPVVICGPSGGGLHAVDEWVDLSQVRRFVAALIEVLSAWTTAAAPQRPGNGAAARPSRR